jgi:hypothetical protein
LPFGKSMFAVREDALEELIGVCVREGRISTGRGFTLSDLVPAGEQFDLPRTPLWEVATFLYSAAVKTPDLFERPADVGPHGLLGAQSWSHPSALTLLLHTGGSPVASWPIELEGLVPASSDGYARCRATTLRLLERVAEEANKLLPAARATATVRFSAACAYAAARSQLLALAANDDLPECSSIEQRLEAWRDRWQPLTVRDPGAVPAEAEEHSLGHDLALAFLAVAPAALSFREALRWAAEAAGEVISEEVPTA